MSDRTTARYIQANSDYSYQAALIKIRKLKNKAYKIVKNKKWTWKKAYVYLILDEILEER
jgi:hypothetical protein